ncbi:uncharacterized protein [Eucyclogobius newberryi]|uniref:uncharacterized protein n=1 Tax=Eucyclogobius newberryi TaxID=166745 RepID=UPI003B5CD5CC
MSEKVEIVRALVNARLTAAAEEICALFERTIAEYEEELCRSKENQRNHRRRTLCFRPDVQPKASTAFESCTNLPQEVKLEQEEVCIKQEEELGYPSVVIQVSDDENEDKSAPVDFSGEGWSKTPESTASSSTRANDTTAQTKYAAEASKDHPKPKQYVCAECGKTFGWRATWRRHITTHSDASPYTCPVCSKRFPQKSHLVTHMVTHTGEKPFSCPECHARFSQKQNLVRHMITHSGERSYGCPACGKLFSHKHSVQLHMLTHTGEKPFSCSLCHSRFTKKPHLNRHMKCCHDGEKPFSCSLCQRSFTQKFDLQRHMKVHTRSRTSAEGPHQEQDQR